MPACPSSATTSKARSAPPSCTGRPRSPVRRPRTYRLIEPFQLNSGGNTDFLGHEGARPLECPRKFPRRESVQSPSRTNGWTDGTFISGRPTTCRGAMDDNKLCLHPYGRPRFRPTPACAVGKPLERGCRSQDSPEQPNPRHCPASSIATRCAKLGLERGIGRSFAEAASAYYMKSPPNQIAIRWPMN